MILLGAAEIEIPPTSGGNGQRQAGLARGRGGVSIHEATPEPWMNRDSRFSEKRS
jgi:hypothetical protein